MAQVPAVFDRVPTVFHRVLTGMLSGQFINTRLRDTAEEARVVDRHISVTHEDGCGCSAKDSWHLCHACICHHCVDHGSRCCRDPLKRQLADAVAVQVVGILAMAMSAITVYAMAICPVGTHSKTAGTDARAV